MSTFKQNNCKSPFPKVIKAQSLRQSLAFLKEKVQVNDSKVLFTTPHILSSIDHIIATQMPKVFCTSYTRISNRAMWSDLFRFNQMNWFCLVSWLCYDLIFLTVPAEGESN